MIIIGLGTIDIKSKSNIIKNGSKLKQKVTER
jgi:hypothetical protein